jgi:hypothetical protein
LQGFSIVLDFENNVVLLDFFTFFMGNIMSALVRGIKKQIFALRLASHEGIEGTEIHFTLTTSVGPQLYQHFASKRF